MVKRGLWEEVLNALEDTSQTARDHAAVGLELLRSETSLPNDWHERLEKYLTSEVEAETDDETDLALFRAMTDSFEAPSGLWSGDGQASAPVIGTKGLWDNLEGLLLASLETSDALIMHLDGLTNDLLAGARPNAADLQDLQVALGETRAAIEDDRRMVRQQMSSLKWVPDAA